MMMIRNTAFLAALAILAGNARGWWDNECQKCGSCDGGGMYLAEHVDLRDVYPPYFYKGLIHDNWENIRYTDPEGTTYLMDDCRAQDPKYSYFFDGEMCIACNGGTSDYICQSFVSADSILCDLGGSISVPLSCRISKKCLTIDCEETEDDTTNQYIRGNVCISPDQCCGGINPTPRRALQRKGRKSRNPKISSGPATYTPKPTPNPTPKPTPKPTPTPTPSPSSSCSSSSDSDSHSGSSDSDSHSGSSDSNSKDSGSSDSHSKDSGSKDSHSKDSGSKDSHSKDSGSKDSHSKDSDSSDSSDDSGKGKKYKKLRG